VQLNPWALTGIVLVAVVTPYLGHRSSRSATSTHDFLVARRTVRSRRNAAAISGEYLSAASFLGIAGIVLKDGADALWFPIGFTAGYVRSQRRALVTVHQDITYIAEVIAGDLLVMHSGVSGAESKKVRVLHRLTRAGSDEPVMTANVLMVAMDLERRRAAAIDEAILAGMGKRLIGDPGS